MTIGRSTARHLFLLLLWSGFARAADWPQWRGPNRDGTSPEKNWVTNWPKEGPPVLWKTNVGIGCASVAVSGGRAFTLGNRKNGDTEEDTVYGFDADTGALVWKYSYPQPLAPSGYEGGPCSTPCVDGQRVYALSKTGQVRCFEAATGKVVWEHLPSKPVNTIWGGIAASPLVDGKLVIVGGIAFDKETGQKVWTATNSCHWSSPVPFVQGDSRRIAFLSNKGLSWADPSDGKSLGFFAWPADQNVADPVIWGDQIFISSRRAAPQEQCVLLRVGDGGGQMVWKNSNLMSYFHERVRWEECVYGCDETSLKCVDLKTGEIKWSAPGARGQLIASDGRLILMFGGTLVVAEASPAGYHALAKATVVRGTTAVPPALSNGRLYCRGAQGDVVCLDLSAN